VKNEQPIYKRRISYIPATFCYQTRDVFRSDGSKSFRGVSLILKELKAKNITLNYEKVCQSINPWVFQDLLYKKAGGVHHNSREVTVRVFDSCFCDSGYMYLIMIVKKLQLTKNLLKICFHPLNRQTLVDWLQAKKIEVRLVTAPSYCDAM